MSSERLSIVVVGAGIAGLAAGLALRSYADVTILESASEIREIGAAVTLGAGVVHMLRRWGVHLEREGGVLPQAFQVWSSEGKMLASVPFGRDGQPNEIITSVHRADLQRAMLAAATDEAGPGRPCQVILGHKILRVDAVNGKVFTADGTELSADVIVGADGIRSNVRSFVLASPQSPQPTGESAYRFLVPVKDIASAKHPLAKDGVVAHNLMMIKGPDTRVIAYPVRGGELMNFVCVFPDMHLNEESADKWTAKGDVNSLLKTMQSWAPVWKDLFACAKGEIGIWQLRDLTPLPRWTKGRTLLIGDAAHAMLPHQASGALSAIEDAEALGAFLRGATRADVPAALQRVFRARFRRASVFQQNSRANGLYSASAGADGLFAQWEYTGAEAWERERPEMVLKEDADAE